MIWLQLILFLVQLIVYPILLYRLYKSFRKKDGPVFKKRIIKLICLGVFSGFFFNILPGSDYFWWPVESIDEGFFNEDVTGQWFISGKLIYEMNGPRAFNGDGYSIKISVLNEKMIEYFEKPNPSFFESYPLKSNRPEWQTKHWTRTPIESTDFGAYKFAHYPLEKLEFELKDLLEENGNYFAYHSNLHDTGGVENYGDIDFFIISPRRKLFVKINHNT